LGSEPWPNGRTSCWYSSGSRAHAGARGAGSAGVANHLLDQHLRQLDGDDDLVDHDDHELDQFDEFPELHQLELH